MEGSLVKIGAIIYLLLLLGLSMGMSLLLLLLFDWSKNTFKINTKMSVDFDDDVYNNHSIY